MTQRNTGKDQVARILVASDFSKGADAALVWAVAIARTHAAAITIAHVIPAIPRASMALELQESVGRRLAAMEQSVLASGIEVESLSAVGKPWEIIVETEVTSGADLIVLGARGQTASTWLSLGSTADRVIRTAHGPVLTVRSQREREKIEIRSVLVPVDFSAASDRAMGYATGLLRGFPPPLKITLMHACHGPAEYAIGEMTGLIAGDIAEVEPLRAIKPKLEQMAESLRDEGFEVQTVASEGFPVSAIEAVAIDRHVDMIAMGSQGRSGLTGMMLGSTAERILHRAPCPVLTVRPLPADTAPDRSMEDTLRVRAS